MSKRLTAKNLLKEVQSIKKQASSGFFKPAPIEYETDSDLNSSIDSVLLDILDGYGFMGATDVIVKGNIAYVKGNFDLELDIKQIKPWYFETTDKEVAEALEAVLGAGYRAEFLPGRKEWVILAEGSSIDSLLNVFSIDFSEPTILDNEWVISGNETNYLASQLSGDYTKDLKGMAAFIKKYTEEVLWWDNLETNWDKVAKDIAKSLGGDWESMGYFEMAYRIVDENSFDQVSLNANNNPGRDYIVYDDSAMGGEIVTKSELSGDYRKDIKYIANAIKKYFR